jgi:hypothetical protein
VSIKYQKQLLAETADKSTRKNHAFISRKFVTGRVSITLLSLAARTTFWRDYINLVVS